MPKITRQTDGEKAMIKELRALYGGMMSVKDIGTEIGRSRDAVQKWICDNHIDAIVIAGRKNYRTTDVALAIESARQWAS